MNIDRQKIPAGAEVEVGGRLKVPKANGRTTEVLVTGISESKVTIDANHPLARNDLILDIQLLEIV
jgi:FKBP-type peptidyl-prolyl cis-trans isomerase 2